MTRCALLAAALAACTLLAGCMEKEPVRVGFIGDLTGVSADLGEAGRNGVILAIEQYNQAGGVNGRHIDLLARDTASKTETAVESARELHDANVVAVIGPMTSNMAEVLLPFHDAEQLVLLSPTVSTTKFVGRDDYLFRVNWTTRDDGQQAAKACLQRGIRRLAAAINLDNRTYADSWLHEFSLTFEEGGGKIIATQPFHSADESIRSVVDNLLESRPDGLAFIAGAADTARLAQMTRKLNRDIPLIATEWAGTEQLIELGGASVEGMTILLPFNADDNSPHYYDFQQRYIRRFGRQPGASSALAYDAATVLLDALGRRPNGMPLKDALTGLGPFHGLQETIQFDRYGDTQRTATMAIVRNGRFTRNP